MWVEQEPETRMTCPYFHKSVWEQIKSPPNNINISARKDEMNTVQMQNNGNVVLLSDWRLRNIRDREKKLEMSRDLTNTKEKN